MLLDETARVIRSKNAGPFMLTIDIFFDSDDGYARAKNSHLLKPSGVADAYGLPVEAIKGVWWDDRVRAAKVSMQRWSSSADPFCGDMFGAHLHVPLSRSKL